MLAVKSVPTCQCGVDVSLEAKVLGVNSQVDHLGDEVASQSDHEGLTKYILRCVKCDIVNKT